MEVKNDRCKMSFHVQDLKPREDDKGGYDIFLVSAHSDIPSLKIATIFVDQRGRGECTLELDINHVAGFDYSLDQFHGLALVCNEEEDIKLPLVGYANKRVTLDWAGRIRRDLERYYGKEEKSRISQREEQETAIKHITDGEENEPETGAGSLPEYEEQQTMMGQLFQELQDEETGDGIHSWKREKAEEEEEEEEKEDSRRDIQQQPAGELQTDDEAPESQGQTEEGQDAKNGFDRSLLEVDEDRHYKERGAEIAEVQEAKSAPASEVTYWERVGEYYKKLFKYNRRVHPFDMSDANVEWVEVPQTVGYNVQGYISSPYRYRDDYGRPYHDHFIVGIMKENDDVRYIIYGVPGAYTDLPPHYMQGFSTWLPAVNGYGTGYWLLYIDVRTGRLVYPY